MSTTREAVRGRTRAKWTDRHALDTYPSSIGAGYVVLVERALGHAGGMPSQTPASACRASGGAAGCQSSKLLTTSTASALGADTANLDPAVPSIPTRWWLSLPKLWELPAFGQQAQIETRRARAAGAPINVNHRHVARAGRIEAH